MSNPLSGNRRVHVFWDDSNIFIAGQKHCASVESATVAADFRIHFRNLFELAVVGRPVGTAICVGSIPPGLQELWDELERTGIAVEKYERGKQSGKEQGADQCLQVHMLRALADEDEPGIAVLLTGDGAGYEDGVGFHADLERMQKKGWGIEVLSWTHSCRKALREWADQVGVYVPLENFYESISFTGALRRVKQLGLTKRHKAFPSK